MINDGINSSHPTGFFCQGSNNKLLVFFSPLLHVTIRVNDAFDIFCDVLDVALLTMQGNRTGFQRAENNIDVGLGSARDTNPQVLNLQSDKLLHKSQDFFTGG